MSYSELIKNFEKIRGYMREFYVYGFKSREAYGEKSLRSYDDEKRRVESWLGDYMCFRRTAEGKTVFLSIDSRKTERNPLFKAWKAKSFTDGDITLHFILFDILHEPSEEFSLNEILRIMDGEYLSRFQIPLVVDESTLRKKLKEYAEEGLVILRKRGRKAVYSRAAEGEYAPDVSALSFYSEVAPCGVVGSFLLDRTEGEKPPFTFKHHYITQTLDSDILCSLFAAISEGREAEIENVSKKRENRTVVKVVPLRIFVSVQNGRQYLMSADPKSGRLRSFRLDYIKKVSACAVCPDFGRYRSMLDEKQKHMWGVSLSGKERTEHVEFTVRAEAGEEYIYRRLLREKRCGEVKEIDKNTFLFSADVYDTLEMLPWIRTFICRIVSLSFSNRTAENMLKKDVEEMYLLYGVGEGENDIQ